MDSDQSTILIVSEVSKQFEGMIAALNNCGHRTLTAANWQTVTEIGERQRPDLIISDLSNPRTDSSKMCRLIRSNSSLGRTPILLVGTLAKDSQRAVEAREAGADDYLEAPCDPLRLVTKVARLIERRQTEDRLRENDQRMAETALWKAEEKYRSIFENALEGIFQSTPDGRFSAANPALVRLLGYDSAEELISDQLKPEWQLFVDSSRRAELEQMLAKNGSAVDFECEVYRKDLSRIWTVQNVRALRDEQGALLSYEGSIEDLTERKKLEKQLTQSQKMEAIGQLAGGIAHDFNNLLTVIDGYSELALQKLREDDPLLADLIEIRDAGKRAAALTRQLLAFSRRQVLQPRVFNLNSVVVEMGKMLRRLIGEDIQLRTVLRPVHGNIKADPGQIEQVIMNLAVNARDAMPNGGTLTLETQGVDIDEEYSSQHLAVKPGRYMMLAISDTGCGMDEETQKRIFEPFFTTKGTGKGTGLGLSTVYGIVKQSGGNIWVYSEPGRGSTFKIYLPLVEESDRAYQRHLETGADLRGAETILLVEDEEILRRLVREVLEKHGYQVLEASDGSSALQTCERFPSLIHLLITDIVMPDMGGGELANRLAQLRPEMKVLYMSGYSDDATAQHGILDSGISFLQKPFTPRELASKVREILDVR
jgi:PAS domain S-box-containing protein